MSKEAGGVQRNFNRSPQAAHPIDIACLSGMLVLSELMQNDTIDNARETGSAIWQAVLIACAVGSVMALLICFALRAFMDDEERDWFTLTRSLAGPVGAKISAIAIFILFADTARMAVTSMQVTATNEFLDKTPMIIVTALFLLVCAISARKKMRGVVRISRMMVIGCAVIILLILGIAWSAYDPNRLFPLGGHGFGNTVRTGVGMAGDVFGDIFIICLLLPVQRGQYGVRRGIGYGFLLIVPLMFAIAICYAMAYPVGGNHYLTPPIQQLAVVSEFGRYLQRLSPLLVFLWASAFLACVSSMLFGMSRSWSAVFEVEDEQPMIWPFAAALFILSLIPNGALPSIFQDRLPGFLRLFLFAVALLPALIGRIAQKGKEVAHAA